MGLYFHVNTKHLRLADSTSIEQDIFFKTRCIYLLVRSAKVIPGLRGLEKCMPCIDYRDWMSSHVAIIITTLPLCENRGFSNVAKRTA